MSFNETFRANPLYATQYEVDFIVCFRILDNPAAASNVVATS